MAKTTPVESTELRETEAELPTPATAVGSVFELEGGNFEVVSQVTRTVLSQKDDVVFFVRVESDPYVATPLEGSRSKKQPPTMCDVLNLQTGEFQMLIMNTVLLKELTAAFHTADGKPDFKGKSFGIRPSTLKKSEGGNAYRVYQILHIRPTSKKALPRPGAGAPEAA